MNDDEIQEQLQRGEDPPGREGETYLKIFSALRREPGFVLPSSFADRVISRLEQGRSTRDLFWLYMGFTGLLVALAVAVGMTGFRPSLGVFTFIFGYPGLLIFGISFILGLQWIDRKYIRKTV